MTSALQGFYVTLIDGRTVVWETTNHADVVIAVLDATSHSPATRIARGGRRTPVPGYADGLTLYGTHIDADRPTLTEAAALSPEYTALFDGVAADRGVTYANLAYYFPAPDGRLSAAEVAEMLGWQLETVYSEHSASRRLVDQGDELPPAAFPLADSYDGRSPRWEPDTIRAFRDRRPGRGAGGGRPRKQRPLRRYAE